MRCQAKTQRGSRCRGAAWNEVPGNPFCHHHTSDEVKDALRAHYQARAAVRYSAQRLAEIERELARGRRTMEYWAKCKKEALVELTDVMAELTKLSAAGSNRECKGKHLIKKRAEGGK